MPRSSSRRNDDEEPDTFLVAAAALMVGVVLYFFSSGLEQSPQERLPVFGVLAAPGSAGAGASRKSSPLPASAEALSSVGTWQRRIYTAPDPVAAFDQARAASGDSRDIVAAIGDVAFVCAQNLDQWGSLTTHGGDKSRMWAAEKLLDRCRNVGAIERPATTGETDLPTRIWEKSGRDAGIAAALAVVRASNLAQDIGHAGKVLVETQSLPLEQLFGADVPALPELNNAWVHAGNLVTCEATGSCGPDSVRTLGFCINLGCAEGADLRRAMTDALPARQMRAVDALYAWMVAERRASTR